jgi:hypothetical protein
VEDITHIYGRSQCAFSLYELHSGHMSHLKLCGISVTVPRPLCFSVMQSQYSPVCKISDFSVALITAIQLANSTFCSVKYTAMEQIFFLFRQTE